MVKQELDKKQGLIIVITVAIAFSIIYLCAKSLRFWIILKVVEK